MIASLILPLLLQSAEPLPECNQEEADSGLQPEMNRCAYRAYLLADAELNTQWKATATAMKERDDDTTGDDLHLLRCETRSLKDCLAVKGNFATLLEGQRAWLAYRDAHCRLEGYTFLGGTVRPMMVSGCREQLSRQRTKELKELIEPFG
jgi:uncharacterized protein YecT (DUF1311 family)